MTAAASLPAVRSAAVFTRAAAVRHTPARCASAAGAAGLLKAAQAQARIALRLHIGCCAGVASPLLRSERGTLCVVPRASRTAAYIAVLVPTHRCSTLLARQKPYAVRQSTLAAQRLLGRAAMDEGLALNVISSAETRLKIAAFDDIVEVMQTADWVGRANVQSAAFAAICNLCADTRILVRAACDAGAIEAVVAALTAHGADPTVQAVGCRTLVELGANRDGYSKLRAASAGAVEAVVAALRAHGANAAVQEHGCAALVIICGNVDNNTVKARAAGAIEAVVAALRAHGANAAVQEHACDALFTLCYHDYDDGIKASAVEAVEATGAVEAVVSALRAHGAHAPVQKQACRALWLLASEDDNAMKAGAAGAVEAVVTALRAHGSDVDVQEHGCRALSNLCQTHEANRFCARAAGALPALEATLAAFEGKHYSADCAKKARSCLQRDDT